MDDVHITELNSFEIQHHIQYNNMWCRSVWRSKCLRQRGVLKLRMQERPCQVLQNMDTACIELQSARSTRWIIDFNFIGRIGCSSQSALMNFAFYCEKIKSTSTLSRSMKKK